MTFSLPLNADTLAQLPRTSGVYIFKGAGTLPLYIGKSVDIRSRVMAHLRAEDEVEMMSQSLQLECIETAGEIGALLLESHLIKCLNPIFNVRLRRLRSLCTLQIEKQSGGWKPNIVSGKDLGLGKVDGLYGLFGSVHSAQSKLRELADQHRLCLGLLGLEKISKRGCFGLQVKTCLGACVGHEERHAHDERMLSALTDMKVHAWPFEGAIELVEQSGDWVQRHRIQDWRYLSTTCSKSSALKVSVQQSFDLDTYKILVKPIMIGS
ncbi:MAG: endonuclease, partial [Betaproteobacteria bacterium]|nr:endonuclease [Betaproteobacteria bacterium]